MAETSLLQALPPATDYLTYLTILEYNLTVDELPTLHGILQDTTLTANIGWDLVHLLLPLLPASRDCLEDVARLGNPREVVLKVTELLQNLGRESDEGEDEAEDGVENERELADKQKGEELDQLVDKQKDEGERSYGDKLADKPAVHHNNEHGYEHPDGHDIEKGPVNQTTGDGLSQIFKYEPSRAASAQRDSHDTPQLELGEGTVNDSSFKLQLQFRTLLEMLSVLHPRIKTRYPSRFLMASIQAIFPAHPVIFSDPAVMEAALGFIRAISGVGRPKLPPRKSSVSILSLTNPNIAPDPEGKDDPLGPNELPMQTRLLQVFLTSTILHYISSLSSNRDIPGMAWCSRLQEQLKPEAVVHFRRKTFGEMFTEVDELHGRDAIVGQIVALARDLGINTEELLSISIKPDISFPGEDVAPPPSASDIPLNQQGSLYLLCATIAASSLFNVPKALPSLRIFPEYAAILSNHFGGSSPSLGIGSGSDAFIDAILFLGFFILNNHTKFVPPADPQVFNEVLLQLAILSAESPSPSLRYHAHVLTSSILYSHPSESVRLEFIRDTLEHCTYENLKASAVGWLKHELLNQHEEQNLSNSQSLFQSPSTISTLAPLLFPNPRVLHRFPSSYSSESSQAEFLAHHSFYLASLNLYYLLLSSPKLATTLQISALTNKFDLHQKFLQPIHEIIHSIFEREDADDADDADDDNDDDDVLHGGDFSLVALFDWNIKRIEGVIQNLEDKSRDKDCCTTVGAEGKVS